MSNDDWDSVSNDTPPDSAANALEAVSAPQPSRKQRLIPDNLVIEGDAFQPANLSGQDIPVTPPSRKPQRQQDVVVKPPGPPNWPAPALLRSSRAPVRARLLKDPGLYIAIVLLLAAGFSAFNAISTHTANTLATATAVASATAFSSQENATASAQAVATVTVSQQIYAQATSGTPAIDDPLSDNTNGWGTFNASWGACGFIGGAYHFTLANGGYWNFCNCPSMHNLNNFALQVQVNIVKGDDGGIVFGSTANSYYRIYVDSGGTYTLYQYTKSNDKTQALLSSSSPAIQTGLNQVNVITVIVNNSNFSFYVNTQFVTSANLSAYTQGGVSLTAESTDQATDVVFSNLKAWTL